MNDLKKVAKVVTKINILIERLEKNHSVIVHHEVSQFYYMQKSSELQLLSEELQQLASKKASIEQLLAVIYPEVVKQWSKDARWLNRIELIREKRKAIL